METIQVLPPISILAGLSEEARQFLFQQARRAVVRAGEVIVREGESGNRMFMIETGQVRIFKMSQTGQEVELAMLGPNDSFGESCILTTLPRAATGRAMVDTVVYGLSSSAFYHLYQVMPSQYSILILNIARDLARRLRRLDEKFAGCQ